MDSKSLTLLFSSLSMLLLALGGCGEVTTVDPGSVRTLVASSPCIDCHSTATSQVTGAVIAEEWKLSHHNTESAGKKIPGFGASCADCHEPAAGHPNSCGRCHGGTPGGSSAERHDVTLNPDTSLKCLKCHIPPFFGSPHFNTRAGANQQAQYVDTQNLGKCRNCHNPHDTTILPATTSWAKSGHGDVNAAAWGGRDFKADKNCLRCHTSTGFLDFVTGTPAFTLPTEPLPAGPSNGVLGCTTCHENYNFKKSVRKVPATIAPYNDNKSPRTFPDIGEANLCIPCHAGRESGASINAVTDFTNAAFVTPHNMAAAATMYLANAFINFTTLTAPVATNNEGSPFASSKTYAKNNLPDNVSVPTYGISGGATSTHRKLGTTAIRNDSHNPSFFVPGNLDSGGPCVVCHLTAGHGLRLDDGMAEKVCLKCHDEAHLDGGDGAGNPLYTTITSVVELKKVMVEPQSEAFQDGLNLLKQILKVKYMIKYDETAEPNFFDLQKDPTGKTAVTDWTRTNVAGVTDAAVAALGSATITPIPAGGLSQIQAKRLMGACFNLHLFARDPFAFLHARTFSQRIVYDALDYLDNNTMDFTALTSSRTLNPAIYFGTNVNVRASDGTLSSESMIWMSGTHFNDPGAIAGVGTLLKPMKLHP
jgi:hypothetical protein